MSRYQDLQLQILHAIYEYAFSQGSLAGFREEDIGKVLPGDMVLGITHAVLWKLHEDDYLDRDSQRYYSISSSGINFIESTLDDPNSRLSALLSGDARPEEDEPDIIRSPIPAADRIVTLNHNSDPYKEAIEALDEAVKAFKEDRLFDNEWSIEKGALLQTIEAGRGLLREAQVGAATVYATIITPLRVIREKYEHSIAAGLVTAGVDQLIPLLGRAISSVLALIGVS
jgi:hypothetical protein